MEPGGVVGGLYKLFDFIGQCFFTMLIGGNRAQRVSLRVHRVVVGGIAFGMIIGALICVFVDQHSSVGPVVAGAVLGGIAGGVLAGILLGYVLSLEDEEARERASTVAEQKRIDREKRIVALRLRERSRIDQAKQQGNTLDEKEEERRVYLVNKGIDPDDPHAVAAAGSSGAGGCLLMISIVVGAVILLACEL